MGVHCSVKAEATLGGVTWAQTDEVLFQGIMKSTITWPLKFAAIWAYQNQRSPNPALEFAPFGRWDAPTARPSASR